MNFDIRNADCMDLMREFPDKHFDLAIVDPPYGISADRMNMGDGFSNGKKCKGRKDRKDRIHAGAGKLKDRVCQRMRSDWDSKPPSQEYFTELFRVSKNQIIWGGNYFPLRPTRCVICWDKQQPWENFSQWEMDWTSFDKPAALFTRQNGGVEPGKIHPTQKPVKLYSWLLSKYAEPGMKILDTHLGSGSIAIACHFAGMDLTASELDPTYHQAAIERIDAETRQIVLL